MNFVSHTNTLGVESKEIPCIPGKGAPTEITEGAVGCLYMDTDNGALYKCTAVNRGVFTWVSTADFDDYATYGLPVLALTGNTAGMDKDNAVSVEYAFQDRSGTCTVKWQGSSSLEYPKKNYTIKFDNAFEAAEGWGAQKKYCAKANFIDFSHARNVVSAKLWGKMVKSRADRENLFGPAEQANVTSGFITEDGTIWPGNEYWKVSDYLEVPTSDAEKVYVSYTTSNTIHKNFCLAFYDENKGFLKRELYNWLPEDGKMVATVTRDIPANTKYIVFSYVAAIDYSTLDGAIIDFDTMRVSVIPPTTGYGLLKSLPNGGAIDGFPIIITINGEFMGLYTFNIPKDGWMFGMSDPTLQQAIVCADQHVAATQFKAEALLDGSDFELEYVSDEDNAEWVKESLNTLIRAVMNSDGTDLETTVAQYLDWESAIDYYILATLLDHGDGTDKNYLLATYDGKKWFFSAYDLDATWGITWNGKEFKSATAENGITVGFYSWLHKVMNLIFYHKRPEIKARYAELRASVLSEGNVDMDFNNFAAGIPSVIRNEDAKKWTTIPSTSASNVQQISNWYKLRCAFIDKQIEALN